MPAIGQWWDILENLGDVNALLKNRTSSTIGVMTLKNDANNLSQVTSEELNKRMGVSGSGFTPFAESTFYWSSTEQAQKKVRRVLFDTTKNKCTLRLGDNDKNSKTSTVVRCILAF